MRGLIGLLFLGAGGFALYKSAKMSVFNPGINPDTTTDEYSAPESSSAGFLSLFQPNIEQEMKSYTPPPAAAPFLAQIHSVEDANGIPRNLLTRLLQQESSFDRAIIYGQKKSPKGALGIAQFMPATAKEWKIDPLQPSQAIPAAGRYLKQLYNKFGSWQEALAAYNWGQGNLARKGIKNAPIETKNYFSQILSDFTNLV